MVCTQRKLGFERPGSKRAGPRVSSLEKEARKSPSRSLEGVRKV